MKDIQSELVFVIKWMVVTAVVLLTDETNKYIRAIREKYTETENRKAVVKVKEQLKKERKKWKTNKRELQAVADAWEASHLKDLKFLQEYVEYLREELRLETDKNSREEISTASSFHQPL